MIHFAELLIVIFGGVIGGIALVLFGWGLILILMPTLAMALKKKRIRCAHARRDQK